MKHLLFFSTTALSHQFIRRYQPSIFFANEPSGLAVRRQDDLIIDDDAEFVPHTMEDAPAI